MGAEEIKKKIQWPFLPYQSIGMYCMQSDCKSIWLAMYSSAYPLDKVIIQSQVFVYIASQIDLQLYSTV